MKISNLILSSFLFFGVANSKSIYFGEKNLKNKREFESTSNDIVNFTENVKYKNFEYYFHCMDTSKKICSFYKQTLENSIDYINNAFEIYQPVVLEFYVFNFDKYPFYFPSDVLGGCMNVNTVILKSSNDTTNASYSYPQALAKQLNLNKQPIYKKRDFVLTFNNMNNDETQFEFSRFDLISLHEIFHGLGFVPISEMLPLNNIEGADTTNIINNYRIIPDSIIDPSLGETSSKEFDVRGKITGFLPLSIYSKYVVDRNTKRFLFEDLVNLYKEFNCIQSYNITDDTDVYSLCYDNLPSKTKKISEDIAKNYYTKEKAIGFLTSDNTVVPLQTFENEYYAGTSVCHIESNYDEVVWNLLNNNSTFLELYRNRNTYYDALRDHAYEIYNEDALLDYRNSCSKEILLETVCKENKHGLIGPGIMKVLKTLGWTEKGEKRSDDIYYVDESINVFEINLMDDIFDYYEKNKKLFEVKDDDSSKDENDNRENPNETEIVEEYTVEADVESDSIESDSDNE